MKNIIETVEANFSRKIRENCEISKGILIF